MELNSQVDHMDEELKLLQSEIKQVLLEIQEGILEVQNPFSGAVVFAPSPPARQQQPASAPPPSPQSYLPPMETGQPDTGVSFPETNPEPMYDGESLSPSMNVGDAVGGYATEFPSEDIGGGFPQGGDSGSGRRRASASRSRSSRTSSRQSSPSDAKRERSDEPKKAPSRASEQAANKGDSDMPGLPPTSEAEQVKEPTSPSTSSEAKEDRVEVEASVAKETSFVPSNDKPDSPSRDRSKASPFASLPSFQFSTFERKLKEGSMDLVTIAGLAQWTSNVMRKIGREHLISLLEVTAVTGRISPETRDILLAFIPLLESNASDREISAKEIVGILAQLDGFLGTVSKTDTRLLPFLLQDDLDVFPLIRP